MQLEKNIYQVVDEDEDVQSPEEFNTIDDYLHSNPSLFTAMSFELLGPDDITSKLQCQITSHGGTINKGGTAIAPTLRWIRENKCPNTDVFLKTFIEDSIKNNKIGEQFRYSFEYVISKSPKIQTGDLVTPESPYIFIPREQSRQTRNYIEHFSAKGSYNCFYGHSQAGKSTFVKTFIVPELLKYGLMVV
jgi:hypothetical protein